MTQTILLEKTGDVICLPFGFCIVCGTAGCETSVSFEQRDKNPITAFTFLAGGIGTLADVALNRPRNITAPFCNSCFARFNTARQRAPYFYLAFLVVVFLTIVSATLLSGSIGFNNSLIIAGVGILFAIALRVWGSVQLSKNSPDIRRVTEGKVLLKVPGHGKILCKRA